MNRLKLLGIGFVSLVFVGCGGGGGGSSSSTVSDNTNFSQQQPTTTSVTVVNKVTSTIDIGNDVVVQKNAKTIDNSIAVSAPQMAEAETLPTTNLALNP